MQVNSHTAAKGMTQRGNHTAEESVHIVPAEVTKKRGKVCHLLPTQCIGSAAHQGNHIPKGQVDRMQAMLQKHTSECFGSIRTCTSRVLLASCLHVPLVRASLGVLHSYALQLCSALSMSGFEHDICNRAEQHHHAQPVQTFPFSVSFSFTTDD